MTAARDGIDGEGYLFDNAWQEARRRLEVLEGHADPATRRRIEALGIRPGWRCCVPGCGAGSIARWLAERVGAGGRVLAVDLDPGLAAGSEAPGLEVRRLDLTAEPLPEGDFDLVQVRLLLMHLPGREALLQKLAAALRPGGWLLVEEHEAFSAEQTEVAPYRRMFQAMVAAVRAAGGDPGWARRLPARFAELGLADVGAEADFPVFAGGTPAAQFWSLTAEQLRPRLVAAGLIAEGEIEAALAVLRDPQQWFLGPSMIAAWGRRPPG